MSEEITNSETKQEMAISKSLDEADEIDGISSERAAKLFGSKVRHNEKCTDKEACSHSGFTTSDELNKANSVIEGMEVVLGILSAAFVLLLWMICKMWSDCKS